MARGESAPCATRTRRQERPSWRLARGKEALYARVTRRCRTVARVLARGAGRQDRERNHLRGMHEQSRAREGVIRVTSVKPFDAARVPVGQPFIYLCIVIPRQGFAHNDTSIHKS